MSPVIAGLLLAAAVIVATLGASQAQTMNWFGTECRTGYTYDAGKNMCMLNKAKKPAKKTAKKKAAKAKKA